MLFDLDDDRRALQRSVRDLLADRFPLSSVRDYYDDLSGDAHPAELWKAAASHGWLGVLVPEEHDGLGLGVLDAAVVARAFGTAAAPGAYLPTLVAGEAIRLAGSPEQRAAWLPRVAAGEVKLTFAFRGHGMGWDADGVGFEVDGATLHGSAATVEYAQVADAIVVAARDGSEVALFVVDPADPAVRVTTVESIDRTTRLASVDFDDVRAERLDRSGEAVLTDIIDRAAVLYAHDLVGVARESLQRTVRHDLDRVQFGRPVGSFQAVKHALADLHVAVTMAEHTTLYAAYAIDHSLPDRALAASIAKAKASDAAADTVAAMIQLHGGIAFTWEHDAHFYFKRAKREEHAYGDATWHRERIARLVVDTGTLPDPAEGRARNTSHPVDE